jgi:hypothetical protein
LIAAVHSLLGLPLRQSAVLIDAALACLLVAAFAELCRLLYRDRSVLPWAALLLLAHPRLNNYFAFVIRDLGYWALAHTAERADFHRRDAFVLQLPPWRAAVPET